MAQIKKFISGQIELEFDHIIRTFAVMLISAVFISGSLYYMPYITKAAGYVVDAIIFIFGIIIYLLVYSVGLNAIRGFCVWRKKIKESKLTKKEKIKRDIDVHLSLALFLTIITALFVAGFVASAKSNLTGFNTSAFQDIATVVIIADSIFVALMGSQLGFYKRRILVMYQVLIVGILFPTISLVSIGLGVPHIFIMFTITMSIFSMYFLFSIFLYYTKLLLKKYGPGEI